MYTETCRSCGEVVPAGSWTCPKCGTNIVDSHKTVFEELVRLTTEDKIEAEDSIVRLCTIFLGSKNVEKLREFKRSMEHLPEREQKKKLREFVRDASNFDNSDSLLPRDPNYVPDLEWYCIECGEWFSAAERDERKCPDCEKECLISKEEFDKKMDDFTKEL